MAIDSIKLDSEIFKEMGLGLAELPLENPTLHLHSLGPVVVIAGANGAGKSRLLRLVELLSNKVLSPEALATHRANLANVKQGLKNFDQELVRIELGQIKFDDEIDLKNRSTSVRNAIENYKIQINEYEKIIKSNEVLKISHQEPFKVIDFVPKVPNLIDSSLVSDDKAGQRADALTRAGSEKSEENAPAYARSILRAALLARDRSRREHDMPMVTQEELAEKELIKLIHDLLGISFHFSLNSSLNLNMGREGTNSYVRELSHGQQVLFQLACMLHAQGVQLRNSVIIMDEPENHLHPSVLNEVVDKLREARGVGQIWLATHSVPLIAHMVAIDPDCLWYAEAGRFTRAGRSPMVVLEGLMGGGKGAADLQALTRLPAEYAATRFLSECLVEPGVVGPDTKDPQTNQIVNIISKIGQERGRALRIVDFGAGVGRLLATLEAHVKKGDVKEFVDYQAFEPDKARHSELIKEIDSIYGDEESSRVFSNEYDLKSGLDAGSVDIIVMCNVLHEISPDEWISLFCDTGPMMGLLASDGYVLVVEDYGIPVGERAHRYGFLLMDNAELVALFDIHELDRKNGMFVRVSSNMERYKDRLVAYLISRSCATRISSVTRADAIRTLHDRMRKQVSAYLDSPPDKNNSAAARDYARNAQLYVNSSLWLNNQSS